MANEINPKEKIFGEFLIKYLENVKKELPESYRAKQLNATDVEASLVIEFETKFLKEPFIEALYQQAKEIESTTEKLYNLNAYISGRFVSGITKPTQIDIDAINHKLGEIIKELREYLQGTGVTNADYNKEE